MYSSLIKPYQSSLSTKSLLSPFRYPGGKSWLIPYVKLWLNHYKDLDVELVEPFVGGGIVSLTAVMGGYVEKATMVEIDEAVSAVWSVILSDDNEWLAQRIENFELNYENLNLEINNNDFSLKSAAFKTILKNRVNRGGIMAPGAGIIKNGENKKGLTSRWYANTLARRIRNIYPFKTQIEFINGDGLHILKQKTMNKNNLLFIDPPYTSAGKRLYKHFEIDHASIFRLLNESENNFLMTYNKCPEIKNLAIAAGFPTIDITMSNTHNKKQVELLISRNFDWLLHL